MSSCRAELGPYLMSNPLLWIIFICFVIVLFPDSAVPANFNDYNYFNHLLSKPMIICPANTVFAKYITIIKVGAYQVIKSSVS